VPDPQAYFAVGTDPAKRLLRVAIAVPPFGTAVEKTTAETG
jgi:hypothetical protein